MSQGDEADAVDEVDLVAGGARCGKPASGGRSAFESTKLKTKLATKIFRT